MHARSFDDEAKLLMISKFQKRSKNLVSKGISAVRRPMCNIKPRGMLRSTKRDFQIHSNDIKDLSLMGVRGPLYRWRAVIGSGNDQRQFKMEIDRGRVAVSNLGKARRNER